MILMLPVCDMRIFSILRSAEKIRFLTRSKTVKLMRALTSVYDTVPVTIIQGTANLPREFTGNSFPKPPMTDNVIQHLAAVNILKNHIVMMLVNDHLTHATYIWVVKE